MLKLISKVSNSTFGVMIRMLGNVSVGPKSTIRWWGLKSGRGNRIEIGRECIFRGRIDFDSATGAIRIGESFPPEHTLGRLAEADDAIRQITDMLRQR